MAEPARTECQIAAGCRAENAGISSKQVEIRFQNYLRERKMRWKVADAGRNPAAIAELGRKSEQTVLLKTDETRRS